LHSFIHLPFPRTHTHTHTHINSFSPIPNICARSNRKYKFSHPVRYIKMHCIHRRNAILLLLLVARNISESVGRAIKTTSERMKLMANFFKWKKISRFVCVRMLQTASNNNCSMPNVLSNGQSFVSLFLSSRFAIHLFTHASLFVRFHFAFD